MKAAVYEQYGPPETVKVIDINKPKPDRDEVLIKVITSTVNRTDCSFRSAEYFISRFFSGLFRPKYKVLGSEFAGIIEETGSEVSEFKIGDRVLVYGATGAIGSAAVQLLKHFGTHVTAVVNTKNVELIRSTGVDEVIDYQKEDFTKSEGKFTFIFDAVGKSSFDACKPLLTKKGIYISTELGKNSENIWYAIMGLFSSGKKVVFSLPTINKEDVIFLGTLVEKGDFKPIIDREYNLDDIVEAYRYVETGQKTGNVLVNIS